MNLSPSADVQFGDEVSWRAFLGDHWFAHEGLYQASLDAGIEVENYQLAEFDRQVEWLERHDLIHKQLAEGWLIDPPPDLKNWDLTQKDDFDDWMQAHAAEHVRISVTVGIE
jgi:hypothetical protein